MYDLIAELAEIVDLADDTNSAHIAEVVVDTITTHLTDLNPQFSGALTPAIELLSLEAEAARLRRA